MSKRPNYQGQKLPAHVVEGVKQMYAMEGNKSAVARAFGINLSTVYRILNREDPEVARENRREALGRLARKASERAESLIDNLGDPPADASYMQKTTAFAILVDKAEKIDKRLDEKHKEDRQDAGELSTLPGTVEEIQGLLRNDLRFLVGVLGASMLQGLLPKEQQVPEEDLRIVQAEVTKLSDLDIGAYNDARQIGSDSTPGAGSLPDDGAGGGQG